MYQRDRPNLAEFGPNLVEPRPDLTGIANVPIGAKFGRCSPNVARSGPNLVWPDPGQIWPMFEFRSRQNFIELKQASVGNPDTTSEGRYSRSSVETQVRNLCGRTRSSSCPGKRSEIASLSRAPSQFAGKRRTRTRFGRSRPKLVESGPHQAEARPSLAGARANSAALGQTWSNPGSAWQSAQARPISLTLGRSRAPYSSQIRWKSLKPKSGSVWADSGRMDQVRQRQRKHLVILECGPETGAPE